MPRRRRIRIHRLAPDGRRYIIEQESGWAHAQIRIWLPSSKSYRRMSIPFDLLDAGSGPAARPAAVQHADRLVASDPALDDRRATHQPTVGALLALACAPDTTRKRDEHSDQHAEWERARREVLALLPASFPLAALSGRHIVSLAKSATLRRACGADVAEWTTVLATHVDPLRLRDPSHLDEAMVAAYCSLLGAGRGAVAITGTWSRRVVELLRAMVRHVGSRDQRFSQWSKFTAPPDFMNDVRALARERGLNLEHTPFRPRRGVEDARALMRELDDPRYWMRDCLVTMVGAQRVGEVRASEVRQLGETVEIFCQRREKRAHRAIWHACEAPVAEVLRALLAGPYAALEAARSGGGPDYRLVADVRWNGVHLERVRTAADAPDPGADGLLDPRAWLLLMLGAEGRMGQVRRSMRSNLHVEGTLYTFVLDVPHSERKRASWLLLAPVQRRAVVFMQTVGYLADLERAFDAGTITDYPLFPQGRLVAGRARVDQTGICDDKQLNDWARDIEARLGLERRGRGHVRLAALLRRPVLALVDRPAREGPRDRAR